MIPTHDRRIPGLRPTTEQISGVIERVTFHNEDSGFCVLRVRTKGHREETTVIGSLPSVTAGEWRVAEGGRWVSLFAMIDPKGGIQGCLPV
jgi:exodeoxyribonuclease V alpha subunit